MPLPQFKLFIQGEKAPFDNRGNSNRRVLFPLHQLDRPRSFPFFLCSALAADIQGTAALLVDEQLLELG